jgi:hypothetical protein
MKLTQRMPNWINTASLVLLVIITILLVVIIYRI